MRRRVLIALALAASLSVTAGNAQAVGPSVLHTYAAGGTYNVSLEVIDRGGNVGTLTQAVTALGPGGQTVTPPPPPPDQHPIPSLHVSMQLMPQSLRSIVRAGVTVRVSSNKAADGISTVSIPRAAARSAHIKVGRASSVVIGRGTVSGIKRGTMRLHLRLARDVAGKLGRLGHVKLTVRLALVAAGGDHTSIDAVGSY